MSNQSSGRRRQPAPTNAAKMGAMPPDHIGLLAASVILMVIGWAGLYQLVQTTLPRIGGELWLFFALLHIAITGTSLPIVRYLNVRFTPLQAEVPPGGIIMRQSVWIGLFVVTCAWLQIPRALSPALMVFIAGVFLVIEVFLRNRELRAEFD